LVSNAIAPPLVILEGGPKFTYMVDGCDACYMAKYNLVQDLWAHHNVDMESNKLERPSA